MNARTGYRLGVAAALLGTALAAGAAQAATQTSNLNVTATVAGACSVTTSPIDFGQVSTTVTTNADAQGAVNLLCVSGTGYSVTANGGGGGAIANRRMINGASQLAYQLYTDSARTSILGDGASNGSAITGTGSGSTTAIPIYGRISGDRSSAQPGTYNDTVVITVTY